MTTDQPGRQPSVPAVRDTEVVAAIEQGGSILDRLARRRAPRTEWAVCRYCGGRGQINYERCDDCDNGRVLLTPPARETAPENRP